MKKLVCVLLIICLALSVGAVAACKKKDGGTSSYDIFISYDEEGKSLSGTAALSFYNSSDNEISDLKFNLYGNAFRQGAAFKPVSDTYKARAYYSGESFGGMEITGVENCAGWTVNGEDENILTVNLIKPVYPEQRVKVTISYTLKLAKVNHRTGVTPNTVNLGNFYPILCAYTKEGFIECPYYSVGDPFLSECANYTVSLDIPEKYTAAASGKVISETVSDGRKKITCSLKNARDFAIVLSDKFQVLTEACGGVEVSYYYFADAHAEESLKVACDSLKYFENTFGDYVYPTLSVVETGFCYGGMEYPALTMIASGQDADSTKYTIVHENAHQWWYAMVGSDQLTCAWQDEGLAEYSTLMFFENNPDYGFTRSGIVMSATRAYRAFFSVYGQIKEEVNTSMTKNLGVYQSELEYSNIAYNKGLIMFDMLRSAMGGDKFVSSLKTYYKKCCGKVASAEALIAAFKTSRADVEGVFSSFIEGKILI